MAQIDFNVLKNKDDASIRSKIQDINGATGAAMRLD